MAQTQGARHGGNQRKKIPPNNSAEHQAGVFGGAFLMPGWRIREVPDAQSLAKLCGTSLEAATIRYRQFQRQYGQYEQPAEVIDFLEEIKKRKKQTQDPEQKRINQVQSRLQSAWENLPHAQKLDPSEYRLTTAGFLIQKSQYLKPRSREGWLEYENEIRSYLEMQLR